MRRSHGICYLRALLKNQKEGICMKAGTLKNRKRNLTTFLVGYLCLALVGPVTPAMAAGGDIVLNGTSTGIAVPNAFLFEPEVPFTSLKNVPTWSELEQLLDNPYAVSYDPATPGTIRAFPVPRHRDHAPSGLRRHAALLPGPSAELQPDHRGGDAADQLRLQWQTFRVVDHSSSPPFFPPPPPLDEPDSARAPIPGRTSIR